MFLSRLTIKNFRGIKDLEVEFDDLCVLIGENNAGKSSILDALRLCLTRPIARRSSIFEEYDYHLPDNTADPSTADPIEITLRFDERKDDEWPAEVSQQLADAEQVDGADGRRSITLRVKSSYDTSVGDFTTDFDFLDLAGSSLTKAKNLRTITRLRQLIPTFHLASLRDATQEFRARSSFWGPFVRSLELSAQDRVDLEAALAELNQKVLDKHHAFKPVMERLKQTAELVPLGDDEPVSIEPIPSKIFDILSKTQINLAAKTGAHIPIMKHGSGTQSLAVIYLFDAFLQSQLKSGYGEHAEPLLTLEEPEAHLHPSAIKSLGKMLQDMPGQKIISTHSGDLLAGVPLTNIRRLRRTGGEICVHHVQDEALTDEEIDKLDYKVRTTRGSLLFSRCWILIEGETEATLIPECARTLDYNLDTESISCIEFSQVGIEKFIKLADQLGIEWIMLADGDRAGQHYCDSARHQLDDRTEADHILQLPVDNMEMFLCTEGFGDIYEENISDQKRADVTADEGSPEYWDQVLKAQRNKLKPKCALEVSQRITSNEAEVPSLIEDLIEMACDKARRTA